MSRMTRIASSADRDALMRAVKATDSFVDGFLRRFSLCWGALAGQPAEGGRTGGGGGATEKDGPEALLPRTLR